jgi:methyltransferase (TIGR00027 family)
MDHSRASETAIRVAAMRAVHQLIDRGPKVLADSVAVALIREASDEALRAELATHQEPGKRHLRANFVLRSRFAEDRLEEAVRRGVRQYIVLGAGLDTFAYRQPTWAQDLAIVEIDHPASQQFKVANLARAGVTVPANVCFLAIDFGVDAVADKLAAAPLDSARPIFVSWLGVTQYLAHDDIFATLNAVASWAGGGEIALTYVDNDWSSLSAHEVAAMKIGETRAAASGEPWISRFSEAAITDLLSASGFTRVEHLSIPAADARYFNGRHDRLRPSRGIGLAYART